MKSLGGVDDPCEGEPEPDECDGDAGERCDRAEDSDWVHGDTEEGKCEDDDECLSECED